MKIRLLILSSLIVLILLVNKYDVELQVALIENEIDNLSNAEIKEMYGEELADFYLLVNTSDFSNPTYSYVRWSEDHYLLSVDSILYGKNGEVIESKDVYVKLNYKSYFGIDILDK